jgi:crotonobetainyl-CoA:carnitine CoA-transferase CaiB-like acyl-CoA transferase
MALNMNHLRARELVRKLVAWADVVIENFTPGQMERWGLDYENIREIKPDVIMISCSVVGQDGPYALQSGHGGTLQAAAGFTDLTGWPHRPPSSPFRAYTDTIGPRFALAAILAALEYRRRTGKGQAMDLSQMETGLHFLTPVFLDYLANSHELKRTGNKCLHAAPHAAYRCRGDDRWCVIAVLTEEQWRRFGDIVALPWCSDDKFATLAGRKENEVELDGLVTAWTEQKDAEEVMSLLQDAGITAGVVNTPEDLLKDPQLHHRGFFVRLDHPEIGEFNFNNSPAILSDAPARVRRSPLLGEHTEQVCKEILNMSDEEYIELLQDGVFE